MIKKQIQNGVLLMIWGEIVADVPYGKYNYDYITQLGKYLLRSVSHQSVLSMVREYLKRMSEI